MSIQWIAPLVEEMRLQEISVEQLAEEAGWDMNSLNAALSGQGNPEGAKDQLNQALIRLEIKKDRQKHRLSADLQELLAGYRETDPEYSERLGRLMGLVQR